MKLDDYVWMGYCLRLLAAALHGEVPVGAIVVLDGEIMVVQIYGRPGEIQPLMRK